MERTISQNKMGIALIPKRLLLMGKSRPGVASAAIATVLGQILCTLRREKLFRHAGI